MHFSSRIFIPVIFFLFHSCTVSPNRNLFEDYPPLTEKGQINAVIEIPSGTNEKWEFDKSQGILKWEEVNGRPRVIDYLGYPGNYGFVPKTLLDRKSGGDGDPLYVLVIGPPEERGTVVSCNLLGVLYLEDSGEKDDKLIAVSEGSTLFNLKSISELDSLYPGVSDIIRIWFTSYKGPGVISTKGFGGREEAMEILKAAVEACQ